MDRLLKRESDKRVNIFEVITHPWVERSLKKINLKIADFQGQLNFDMRKKQDTFDSVEDVESDYSLQSEGQIYFDHNYEDIEFYEDDIINHQKSVQNSPQNSIEDDPQGTYREILLNKNIFYQPTSGLQFNHPLVKKYDRFYMKKVRLTNSLFLSQKSQIRNLTIKDVKDQIIKTLF